MHSKTSRLNADNFTKYQIIVVALLALTQFSVVLDFMVMSPLGDILMRSLNITPKQFGFAVSCYAFSAAVSGFFTAGFADLFDRKKLLLFFYIGFIVGTLGCAIAPSYGFLILGRIVTGVFGGVISSISLTIVSDLIPLNKRGRAMGYLQMGFGASQVLGLPIGLYLADHFGWHAPFTMIVILGGSTAIAVSVLLKPVTAHLSDNSIGSFWGRYVIIFKKRDYRKAFMLTTTVYIGGFLMQPFSSAYFINNLHIHQAQLPIIFLSSGIASLFIMPIIGKLSDLMPKSRLFAIGSCWAIIFTLIYTHLPPIPLIGLIAINIGLFMGVLSRSVPATATISAVPYSQDRGTFLSINSCIQQLAGGVAAALAGFIVKQRSHYSPLDHFTTLGYFSASMMLLSMFLMFQIAALVSNKQQIKDTALPDPV